MEFILLTFAPYTNQVEAPTTSTFNFEGMAETLVRFGYNNGRTNMRGRPLYIKQYSLHTKAIILVLAGQRKDSRTHISYGAIATLSRPLEVLLSPPSRSSCNGYSYTSYDISSPLLFYKAI